MDTNIHILDNVGKKRVLRERERESKVVLGQCKGTKLLQQGNVKRFSDGIHYYPLGT